MLPLLYHTHHSLHNEDLPFWLGLAQRAGGPLLELGCGTGRALAALARAGYIAVGLDRETDWLRFLRQRLPPGLSPAPRVLVADMAAFHLAERFGLILLPCNTLSMLSLQARQETLACARRHLRPGGLFAAGLPNLAALRSLPRRGESEVEETFVLPELGLPVQVSSAWERERREFVLRWHYDLLHPDGQVERFSIETRHALTPEAEWEAELEAAGLQVIETYGDYDGTPVGQEAPHWIVVARRV